MARHATFPGQTMRRHFLRLCLIGAVAAGALATQAFAVKADELRFPQTGKHAFHVTLLKGWRSKADARGGLLLVPPAASQHAMIYLAILVDDTLRGAPAGVVAGAVAKPAGFAINDKQDPARMSNPQGTRFYRGTAFYGATPAKRGLARRAKIVIFALAPNTWAQVWVVTQPGINSVELAALDRMLNGITLASEP